MQRSDIAKQPPDLSEYGVVDPYDFVPEDPALTEFRTYFTPEVIAELRAQHRRTVEIAIFLLLFQPAAVTFLYSRKMLR
jgi:hypothetical protein